MSTFTICDNCGKERPKEERWPSIDIHVGELKIKGLKDMFGSYYHFCNDCGKILLTKVNKILNKKYGHYGKQ